MTTISVITATYNCQETLPDCLESLASQEFRNIEHIVIDGESTDATMAVANKHRDQVAVLISERDSGIYDALNKGIAHATGDIVGFLHADDVYASGKVLGNVAKAFEDPEVCAIYGDLEYVSKHNLQHIVRRWRGTPFSPHRLYFGWMPAHPTLYVRREWYSKIGGFDVSYKIAADYLSVLQLFTSNGFKAVYLPQTLVKMRTGGASNRSIKALIQKSREDWRALRSSGFNIASALFALAWKNLRKIIQFL